MKKKFLLLLGLASVLLVGCGNNAATTTKQIQILGAPTASLANPASVNCADKGGRLDIRTNDQGQYGVCVFPDNHECEEWAFFRGTCK